jgi:hypothetical protein
MTLHRLLGMRIGVPDAPGLAAFYDELGLQRNGIGHHGTDGGAVVRLEEYDFRRLLEVRVGAGHERHLDEAASRLDAMGVAAELRGGELTVTEPHTRVTFRVSVAEPYVQPEVAAAIENAPGNAARRNRRASGVFPAARPPRRLGHMVIGTPNLAATRDLLVHGLGFKVSDDMAPIITFLRCSTDHHNVALVDSPVPLLQHYSWECDDADHVGHAATALLRADEHRQVWGFGRHFIGSNYYWYLRDPSGSFLELYSDMDVIDDDDEWEREGRTPVGFEHVANSWGPSIPMEFIEPTDIAALTAAWAARP